MTVWTIASQEGTPGHRVAAELASAAQVPFYDRAGLAELGRAAGIELPDLEKVEERFCGRAAQLISLASGSGNAEVFAELNLRRTLPELGRRVIGEAARGPCVIDAGAAFAILDKSLAAVHVRIRAPFEWRVAAYQREQLVNRHHAEKAVHHRDHLERAWVRMLYHLDVDDGSGYTLVLDASRLSCDRLVEILLAAGGIAAGAPASR
jgi:hypothetical protein